MQMHQLRAFIVPFTVAGTVLLGVPGPVEAARTVRCESQGGNRHTCNVGLSGRITLQRQLSRAACIEGQTWGAVNGEIWVSGGCRAEFRVEDFPQGAPDWGRGGGTGGTIRCESRGRGRNYCPANTSGGVHLTRQLSRTDCVYQRSWGYDSGGIWVTDGCRAEFQAGSPGWGGGGGSFGGNTVRCESQGGGRNYCRADTRGCVSLTRQLSRAACLQGQSWGYDGGGIWVDDGCRAEFHLGYQGYDGGSSHGKGGNNTAAVAAGALLLGALIAVAASSGSKDAKERKGTVDAGPPGAGGASWAGIACRSAIQQKVLDHYGSGTVLRFADEAESSPEAGSVEVEGTGTLETNGRSWEIAYRCLVDESSRSVVETHLMD